MYFCMRACLYVCIHVCMYVCLYICMYMRCVCLHAHVRLYEDASAHVYVCVYTKMKATCKEFWWSCRSSCKQAAHHVFLAALCSMHLVLDAQLREEVEHIWFRNILSLHATNVLSIGPVPGIRAR